MSLRVDEISNEGGTGPVVLTDQIAAKIYASIDGESATPALQESLGASSVVDNSTGNYTLNFTTAMNSSVYGISGVCGEVSGGGNRMIGITSQGTLQQAASLQYITFNSGGAAADSFNYPHIVGDLA